MTDTATDQEAAPKTSDAVVVCLHPDFCRRGDSIVAYDIIARGSDDVSHSRDVKITGCWACHAQARLSTVYQDSPGDAGVKSGCVEGYARPVRDTSATVLVNGEMCVRHDTEYEMNCNGPEGAYNTTGKMVYERGKPSNVFGVDGVPEQDPRPPIEDLTEAEEARGFVARTAAVIKEDVQELWAGAKAAYNNPVAAIYGTYMFHYMHLGAWLEGGLIPGGPDGARELVVDQYWGPAVDDFLETADEHGLGPTVAGKGILLGVGSLGEKALAISAKAAFKATSSGFLIDAQLDPAKLREMFTNEQLDELVATGDLDPQIAARAKAAGFNVRRGNDGVIVNRLSVRELVDRILRDADVVGDDDFKKALREDLEKVGQTPEGRANLESLANTEHDIVFNQSTLNRVQWPEGGGGFMETRPGGVNSAFVEAQGPFGIPGEPVDVVGPGRGSGVIIDIDPSAPVHPAHGSITAHEIQHAANVVDGVAMTHVTSGTLEGRFPNLEELSAVTAENAMQDALGLPPRKDYADDIFQWPDDGPID